MKKQKLTAKQEQFVQNVIKGMNQTQAYKAVYKNKMTDKQACEEASAMLNGTGKYAKNPKVCQRYKELNEKVLEKAQKDENKAIASGEEVLMYFTSVMRGEATDEQIAVNQLGEVELVPVRRQVNQLKAAEALAKKYGLLVDKTESKVDMDLNIKIDYGND